MTGAAVEDRLLMLGRDGVELWAGAASGHLPAIIQAVASQPADHAGIRLTGIPAMNDLLDARGAIGALVARHLGPAARPVRMILFDKSAATNWALGWHQDRTIVVRNRREYRASGRGRSRRECPMSRRRSICWNG